MKTTVLSLLTLFGLTMSAQTARQLTVNLTDDGRANMVAYLPENPTGRAVVDLPGGGYSHLSMQNEGHDWAEWFNRQGIAFFVVTYRMPNGDRTIPMGDAQRAIRTVRDSAAVWSVNPYDVGVMGFSAGGHLASTVSTHSELAERPDFSILFYPVISMNERETHKGSCVGFLGPEGQKDERLVKAFSNQNAVRRHLTPPAIILLANDDRAVPPVTNGIAYYSAMRRAGNECTMHVYPTGGHGFGFRSSFKYHDQMLGDLQTWLDNHKAPRQDAVRVACIGNSITDGSGIDMADQLGYPAQLGRQLGSGYNVKNYGVGARCMMSTSDHPYMQEQAWRDVQAFQPHIVVIKLGTNDSKDYQWNRQQYERDYQLMLDTLRSLPTKPAVYLCTPIKAFRDKWGITDSVIVSGVIPSIRKIAKKNKLTVIDLHPVIDDKALMTGDMIHPNDKGAAKMAKTVAEAIKQHQQLWQSFLTPPDSIRVGCYYYWVNEQVDPEGVRADLQWMKQNGITLAFLATDIRNRGQGDDPWAGQTFGKNKFQSKLWWTNLRTALKTAGELDIEMGLFNCPGWSQSGGPWVKPEEAMRNWTPNGIEVCKTKEGTDVVCSPCSPEATGLEVDKLSKAHVKKHFEAFFGEILRRIPQADRPTLTTVVVDSWERGKQDYTDSIFVKFKQRFGYELDYTNEACKKDLDQLIADLVASEYMGGLTEKAHEYGLRTWCEPYAHSPFPANSVTYGSAADEVAAEFWVGDKKFRKKEVDAALWSARRSGKNRVWAESFTDGWPELAKDDWSFEKLKPIADRYFHAGINASILHVMISQPGDDSKPAVRPWFGTYFDRRSQHAADLKPLVEYLRRCNFMLQLGKPYSSRLPFPTVIKRLGILQNPPLFEQNAMPFARIEK